MTIIEKISAFVTQILPQDYFLIQVRKPKLGQKIKVVVVIDGDKGVDVEVCALVSRQLGEKMEEENWLDTAYILEVTSPGAETPLVLLRQYPQHIGRNIKITTNNPEEILGKLTKVELLENSEESFVEITPKSEKKQKNTLLPFNIFFKDIQKAQIVI
jgi:ribosome maturation factor RimP